MKLKICGVQTVQDAQRLAAMGVDYVGLNFVPSSRRLISLETAVTIAAALKTTNTKTVALFQDQPIELVQRYAQTLRPDFIQLHGHEDAAYIRHLDRPVIRTVHVAHDDTAGAVLAQLQRTPAHFYLLDRAQRATGAPIAAALARHIVTAYPQKIFLAGGLSPRNLEAILQTARPYATDIAGGVRTDAVIDFEKVTRVLEIMGRTS